MMSVDLTLLKSQLNVIGNDDDALLTHKIAAAEDWISNYLGKPLVDFDPFPASLTEATLQLAAHLYENREAVLVGVSASELPFGLLDFLRPYRVEVTGYVPE